MPDQTNQELGHIRAMQTVEMFAGQEDFIRRNLTELSNAIEQATMETVQFIQGRHPQFRRLISDLRERAASAEVAVGRWSDQRLLNVLDAINDLANEITRITGEHMIRGSSAVARDVYQNYPEILSFDGEIPLRSTMLSSSQIRALVEDAPVISRATSYQGFVERVFRTPTMRADLRNEMLVGAFRGEGIPKLTRRIRDRFDWMDEVQLGRIRNRLRRRGINPGDPTYDRQLAKQVERAIRHNTITAARTHMQTAANTAMENIFSENEDIIEAYEWNATMETGFSKSGRGTCVRCAGLDGNVYPPDEQRPPIPLHPNCRCFYTPVLKDWQDLGIDAPAIQRKNRAYLVRESDYELAVGKGRAIGAGGRKILGKRGEQVSDAQLVREGKLGPVTRHSRLGNRNYSEWYADRNSLFKVNVTGPSRANWIESADGRSLNDLVDPTTGDLILLEDLPGNAPIITRQQYVEEHGTTKEKRQYRQANK